MKRIYRLQAIAAIGVLIVLLSASIGRAELVIDRMAHMAQQGVLSVGVRADAFPFSYFDAEGQPAGFSIDLVKRLEARLEDKLDRSIELKFVPVNPTNRYEALHQNRVDLLCDSSSFSRSRAMDAAFSIGYFQTGTQLLVKQDDTFGNQFRIGIIPGTTNADSIKRRLAFAQFVNLPDREAGMEALQRNRIDALASDGILLEAMRQNSPDPNEFNVIPRQPYDEQTYSCLMPTGNDRFAAAVDATLTEFMQGVLNQNPADVELFDRWFGAAGAVPVDRETVLAFFRRAIGSGSTL